MNIEKVKRLLKEKEGIQLEFKEAKSKLPSNLYESVCAMLNRKGGDLLLGVKDDGSVIGIDKDKVEALKKDLVNLSNNPEKLNPPFVLFPQEYMIEDKMIIHISVPLSSQVHQSNKVIYDRSNDGDFKITDPIQISNLVLSKGNYYTENEVFPHFKFEDFDPETFEKARQLIARQDVNHPWLSLTNKQMLKRAGLWRKDSKTMEEGYTLAAILLFAKEEMVRQILPYYKVDLIVRKDDLLRYDDRDYIECNLIDAFDRIMAFVKKHLPDNFYLEDTSRLSLRSKIFREIAANVLVHREYRNANPTIMVIYKDRVEVQNANNPKGEGELSPDNFVPFSKNPFIAKFFVQLGHVDELGSGIVNVNKYIPFYAPGRKPHFIEGEVFKTIIPVGRTTNEVGTMSERCRNDVGSKIGKDALKIMLLLEVNPFMTTQDISAELNKVERTVERYLSKLKSERYIERKGPKLGGYWEINKDCYK